MCDRVVNSSSPNTNGTVLAGEALNKFAQCDNIEKATITFVEDGVAKTVELVTATRDIEPHVE